MTKSFIPLSVPTLSGNEWQYIKECLDSGWVSSAGHFVDRFERQVADYVGASHSVAVTNGTAALHIALLTVGVLPEDEVIVSNLTFVAPVNAILYVQARPILMDADPKTWQMDVKKLEQFLVQECEMKKGLCRNKKTGGVVRAIVPVHLLGLSCDIDHIVELARHYRLKVVEDSAQGMGVRYRGRHVGTFGDIGAFSFNGNKVITAGGGGMIVTNSKEHADYARYLTTQAKDDPIEYVHNQVGYNYRLNNLQAALGVAQLEQLATFLQKKREIAAFYQEIFGSNKTIQLMPTPLHCQATYWLYTVLLSEETPLEKRKRVIQIMNENGVGARSFWHTVHDMPAYAQFQSFQIEHSVHLYERGVCLPSSVDLTPADLKKVVDVFYQALNAVNA